MTSSFGLNIECLSFFSQSLVWHLGTESRHNKNFDIPEIDVNILFPNCPPPDLHTDAPVIALLL